MIEICKNIEYQLKEELKDAEEIWTAVAMMNSGGLSLFSALDTAIFQNHIVGIDLPTPPKILKSLLKLSSDSFVAKVYETDFIYHPKLYIIKQKNNSYTAFVGSSNATYSGLNRNVELNLKITDRAKCLELIDWFNTLDLNAKLITDDIINQYSKQFKVIKKRTKEINADVSKVKSEIERLDQQFFSSNHHAIFAKEYRKLKNKSVKKERIEVRSQLVKLHNRIYPRFKEFGISKLYTPARAQERTSRHYPSPFSGMTIRSIWLHYGKSPQHLRNYRTKEEQSFINHARIQVIIHNNSVGTWLVLGKNWGSEIDRKNFRSKMKDPSIKRLFYRKLKDLDEAYWLRFDEGRGVRITDLENLEDFSSVLSKETLGEYFIIGKDYANDDPSLSDVNIEETILNQFAMLYPLYEIMVDAGV